MELIRRLGPALLLAALTSAGCGAARPDTSARASIAFDVEPESARIYTEDRFVGSARVLASRPPSFRTGARQITISADGYFPVDLDLDLAPGTTSVRVRLRPIPE